jgi:hypothetical protein
LKFIFALLISAIFSIDFVVVESLLALMAVALLNFLVFDANNITVELILLVSLAIK